MKMNMVREVSFAIREGSTPLTFSEAAIRTHGAERP